ncbi:hypothetical protein V1524DRAFT_170190 [Lipomyces starkeyi]
MSLRSSFLFARQCSCLPPSISTSMDRSSSKRKRIVTACSECHRRKQKCDRARPCNNCIARNVQDRCSYGNPTAFEQVTAPQGEDPWLLELRNEVDVEQISGSLNLLSQAGYSSVHDSNAFTGLQEVTMCGCLS